MKRRNFLTGCAGCAAALAGCAGAGVDDGSARHPFAGETVRVRVDDRSETDHDLGTNAREALAYWVEHADQYAGFDVDFEVVDDDAALSITYVDSPEPCRSVENFSESVLGCAPLVTPGSRLSGELTAYVVAANRPFGKIRITTKHEIGHTLGLYHDAEPREIMSNRPEDRIPLYATRIDIWEAVLGSGERSDDGTRLFELGVESWNGGRYGAAEAAFDAANDEFAAAAGLVATAFERTAEFVDHPRVETVALDDLRAHLTRLGERMTEAEGFTRRMASASAAAAAGDDETANEHLSAANGHVRAFNDIGAVELRSVAVALGVVRGFDRDEPVVGIDEGELE